MIRTLPIAGLLLLAACSPEQAPPAANEAASAPAAKVAKSAVPSLEGIWQVTMIGGSEARTLDMTATLGGGRAILSTGCFRRAWTYSQKGNVVDFTSSPTGSSNCGGQAPGPQEEIAYAALDGVNMAIFSGGGRRADLSGDSGTVTLERR